MKPFCVIPARLNSKNIFHKSIVSFCDKPLIKWSIDAAFNSGLFEEIVIATESELIAEIVLSKFISKSIKIHYLPIELVEEKISATMSVLHYLDSIDAHGEVFMFQPTSPLKTEEDIIKSWELFNKEEANFLVSGTDVDPHHFHWALEKWNKYYELYFLNKFLKPREELPKIFGPDGSIKIAKIDELRKTKHFFGNKLTFYNIPKNHASHIATQEDFEYAEFLMKKRFKK